MSPRLARIALALTLVAIYSTLGVVRPLTDFLRARGSLRLAVFGAFAIAALTTIALIFRDRRNRTPRVALTLIAVAIVYAAAILPMESTEEKIHFIQYGIVALLAYAALGRRYIAAALFTLAAGWIDEGIQFILPSRIYDPRDVAFNAAAGVMALVALAVCSPGERALGPDRPEELAEDAGH